MNNYDKYLDMLMRNYPLLSQSSEEEEYRYKFKKSLKKTQKGGAKEEESLDAPFGGFPPIFLCSNESKIDEPEKKEREYSKLKTSVSIRDIMKKRRDTTPFISSS
jgi:hypothetical protein